MSSTMGDMLDAGEKYQRVFVAPLVEAVRQEMQTHIADVKKALDTVNGFEGRVSKLEAGQKKALIGWSVYATGAAALLAWGWNYLKSKVKLG